jgi:acyl dehydratase
VTEGRFLEDFKVGDTYRSPAGRTVTQADNIWFSLITNNQNPIHIDEHYSAQTEFKRPLVNSVFTVAVVTGLMVPDTSQNGFALGWDEITLPNPLFEGDTLYADSEVSSRTGPSFSSWSGASWCQRAPPRPAVFRLCRRIDVGLLDQSGSRRDPRRDPETLRRLRR